MDIKIEKKYEEWLHNVPSENDLYIELTAMKNNSTLIEDAFYKDLSFGTAGLRGVIGAGTNRMNIFTVAKTSQGIANYINKNFESEHRKMAISYDSRIKSKDFAKTAAAVFAANGIKVYIYSSLMPVPCLSFAVRYLGCASGVMITASHNPAKYNGYKVYDKYGCQIGEETASAISDEIEKTDAFKDVKTGNFEEFLQNGMVNYIDDKVYDAFIYEVKRQSVLSDEDFVDKNVSIVYTPLNGTGLHPVLRALKESGYTNITVVAEQSQPDGNFPTCPYPNPEIREAMALGIEYAGKNDADILIATDPDCDRVGIAVKDKTGGYRLLTGNETGILLFDFICRMRIKNGAMPQNPVAVKTIVSTGLVEKIAAKYGVKIVNVLTGFKYIGEQIFLLEEKGEEASYIFGFEESYGYLTGTYVRDKDAVNASFLICEMFAYYKSSGLSLIERLNEIYSEFGYRLDVLKSYTFEGVEGFSQMQKLMACLRNGINCIGDAKVMKSLDYSLGLENLPKADVLKFFLSNGAEVIIRPSGTEPKIKAYISVNAKIKEDAENIKEKVIVALDDLIK